MANVNGVDAYETVETSMGDENYESFDFKNIPERFSSRFEEWGGCPSDTCKEEKRHLSLDQFVMHWKIKHLKVIYIYYCPVKRCTTEYNLKENLRDHLIKKHRKKFALVNGIMADVIGKCVDNDGYVLARLPGESKKKDQSKDDASPPQTETKFEASDEPQPKGSVTPKMTSPSKKDQGKGTKKKVPVERNSAEKGPAGSEKVPDVKQGKKGSAKKGVKRQLQEDPQQTKDAKMKGKALKLATVHEEGDDNGHISLVCEEDEKSIDLREAVSSAVDVQVNILEDQPAIHLAKVSDEETLPLSNGQQLPQDVLHLPQNLPSCWELPKTSSTAYADPSEEEAEPGAKPKCSTPVNVDLNLDDALLQDTLGVDSFSSRVFDYMRTLQDRNKDLQVQNLALRAELSANSDEQKQHLEQLLRQKQEAISELKDVICRLNLRSSPVRSGLFSPFSERNQELVNGQGPDVDQPKDIME